jgi:ubiquinone/menaquinone biosynthesis C-methylase UbiE
LVKTDFSQKYFSGVNHENTANKKVKIFSKRDLAYSGAKEVERRAEGKCDRLIFVPVKAQSTSRQKTIAGEWLRNSTLSQLFLDEKAESMFAERKKLLLSIIEKIRSFTYRQNLAVLISLLQPKKEEVILDVGAGTGWIASQVAEFSDEVFALEPNEKRVDHIRTKHPQVKAFSSVANSIPFPPNYFDKLFVVFAFHHFPDQEDALEEFRRVLKKGGLLLIHEDNPKTFGSSTEKRMLGGDVRFVSNDELESMAKKHEFQKMDSKVVKRGYFILLKNAKSGEEASGWLGDSVKEEKAMRTF